MTHFDTFIGIDYSGARTSTARLPGLRVYAERAGSNDCHKIASPASQSGVRTVNWTRKEIAGHLLAEARSDSRFIAGIDHCFSFPDAYFVRYGLRTWPAFLADFVEHWPTHRDLVSVDFVRNGLLEREGDGPRAGQRTGRSDETRICERWTSSAKSVFQFDMQGSVAKSSHAGIPWLAWLREQAGDLIHFWPFDGWEPAPEKSVIAEAYPSIFRKRYARNDRTQDEQDAYAVARWLGDMAGRGALDEYFFPPLADAERELADHEGWILGIR